jgi:hypothetical protein
MSSSSGGSYPHEPPFFLFFSFSNPFCDHRIQSDDGTQIIKLAGPAKRFQILIVLTIRAL